MKAILVINMPKDCGECMLLADGYLEKQNRWFDKCWVKQKLLDNDMKKPKWCPLKPMPQKKEVEVNKIEDIMNTEFQMVDVIQDKIKAKIKLDTDKLITLGWNACIDMILENNNETNI